MRFNEEVFAVLLAIVVVACIFTAAQSIPRHGEAFTAIGLLNEECKIGDYPRYIVVGEPVTLCIYLSNHLGKPALLQVRMKIGSKGYLPTNTTPLNTTYVVVLERVLDDGENVTQRITFVLNRTGTNLALVFELWRFDTSIGRWVYDGKWVHLYVNITRVVPLWGLRRG